MSTVQSATGPSADVLAAMNPGKKEAKSTAAAAEDKFLTLLVTQMRNQDPLNPLDNAQVTSQLAQLSTVTGIDKVNATLEALQGSMQSNQSLQAASMIGRGVLAPGSTLHLSEGKAFLGVELAESADSVQVTIRDSSGNPVRSIDLGGNDAGMLPLQWDGKTDSGADAASGKYTFDITARRAGKAVEATALAFGDVASVASGAQGVKLNVLGIGEVKLADIRQIL